MTTLHLATFPPILVGGKFIDGVKGAVAGMAIGAAVKWAMTPSSQSPANATSSSQDPAGKDGANTSTPDSKLEGDLIDKAWAEADKLGVPHGNVPYEYTGSELNCGGGAAWGCNYGGDRIKFGLGSATGTEGQRWFRGAWIKELRNNFEQALYVVTHERIHSTPMNQVLQSESALPYGYNKETHANKQAMKYLQEYRNSK